MSAYDNNTRIRNTKENNQSALSLMMTDIALRGMSALDNNTRIRNTKVNNQSAIINAIIML